MGWGFFFLGVLVGFILAALFMKSSMAKIEEDAYRLGYRAGQASHRAEGKEPTPPEIASP